MKMKTEFIKEISEPQAKNGKSLWFAFRDDHLLVESKDKDRLSIPVLENLEELKINPLRTHYLGRYGGYCCYAAEVAKGIKSPSSMFFHHLWGLYDFMAFDLFRIAGYAFHLMKWEQTSQYCGRCGTKTNNLETERAKICENCNLISYPRISPAVITAVIKDNKILLARAKRFKRDMYSILAGFVEPGETLEECVKREIKEEVNIEVENIRYFGSQPWPFPDSLMIGFTADYKSGEIASDGEEILHADWFSPDNLPNIPGKLSIARELIDWFCESVRSS
jgi:NAD+ diphosphatase